MIDNQSLRLDLDRIAGECVLLGLIYYHQRSMYSGIGGTDQLNTVASDFFGLAAHCFSSVFYLGVARLTDPAQQGSNHNLSFSHIHQRLCECGVKDDHLSKLHERLITAGSLVNQYRNKVLAHSDLPTMHRDETFRPLGEIRAEDFLDASEDYLRLALTHVHGRKGTKLIPTLVPRQRDHGVDRLRIYLKTALAHEQELQSELAALERQAEDFCFFQTATHFRLSKPDSESESA